MEIEYIFRPKSKAVSIEKVFENIIGEMKKRPEISIYTSEVKRSYFWPITILYNILRYAINSYSHRRIFHITGDIQYVGCLMNPKNTILTIHDCVPLHDPTTSKWFRPIVFLLWYKIPIKHLHYITCISETTKSDIISFFPWAKNKINVINNPVGEEYKFMKKQLNYSCPRILHVGTRNNKNLERVIRALAGFDCQLVVIGKLTNFQIELLQCNDIDFINRYFISDEEIIQEYFDADIISFPSLFEGFGMPIIEGQSIGRPVLTSNREPMSTIANGAAVLVDPESIESIRHGFYTIVTNREYTESIIEKGYLNCRQYQANVICEQYLAFYSNID